MWKRQEINSGSVNTKYKGIRYLENLKQWESFIIQKGEENIIGQFEKDYEAALATDENIRNIYGEKKELLNFPIRDIPGV